MKKKKFFVVTTIPDALKFLSGQYGLIKESFDITAISSQRENLEAAGLKYGVKVHYIPMEREISLLIDSFALLRFIQYFRRERPTVVHGNTPKGGLLSMMAAWITKVPVRIYVCHGLRYQGCEGFKRKLLMLMEKISCCCATHVITVSYGMKKMLKEDRITDKEPIVVWNGSISGVDAERFDPGRQFDKEKIRDSIGLASDNFVLTFVGRIVKDKGIDELVDAFTALVEKHPDMRLVLVGTIEEEGNPISPSAKKTIQNHPAIIALGERYDIPEILSVTDLFVFPSYREGFGLSLMEAGAMGVPAVATDIIGCNEVLVDGETGVLIPPHSSTDIVNVVDKLYTNKDLMKLMGENCRAHILSKYEAKKLLKEYVNLYNLLVEMQN